MYEHCCEPVVLSVQKMMKKYKYFGQQVLLAVFDTAKCQFSNVRWWEEFLRNAGTWGIPLKISLALFWHITKDDIDFHSLEKSLTYLLEYLVHRNYNKIPITWEGCIYTKFTEKFPDYNKRNYEKRFDCLPFLRNGKQCYLSISL